MPDLSDDEWIAIGKIAIGDAGLNQLVEYMCWALIDDDDNVGATVTARQMFARVLETLRRLIRFRIADAELRAALLSWLKKVEWFHRQRNSILHSALLRLNPKDERLTHFRFVPGENEAQLLIESFNPASLELLVDALQEIAEEGVELFERFQPKPKMTKADEVTY